MENQIWYILLILGCFNGYTTEMFPSVNPVRPELINIGAICEEMSKVISFTTVVTGFTVFNFNVIHGITLWTILYWKDWNFCISYYFEGEFKYSWPNIILSTVKVCIMIRPFMYWLKSNIHWINLYVFIGYCSK